MKTIIAATLLVLLLSGCSGQTNTTTWSQSASASCTGWFCRAQASNIIAPTQADEVIGWLALILAGGMVLIAWAGIGRLLGWW
jgi:ABC-type Fe3+-hydroxamate transport system substrate-binding protein